MDLSNPWFWAFAALALFHTNPWLLLLCVFVWSVSDASAEGIARWAKDKYEAL